jgi:hypothetical protein
VPFYLWHDVLNLLRHWDSFLKKSALENKFAFYWKSLGGMPLVEEHQFSSLRKWRFDYAHLSTLTAFELDGGMWAKRSYRDKKTGQSVNVIGGRHNSGKGYINDCEKINTAVILGWQIIRVPPELLTTPNVTDWICYVKHKQGK